MRTLSIALICILTALVLSAPVVAASDVPPCVAMGTAEGQTLYFCENEFTGMDCVWDPSSVLGAGVMDCD